MAQFNPFSATFDTRYDLDQYAWISQVPEFSSDQLTEAVLSDDPTYLTTDSEMPARVRELAFEITDAHESPYLKARAIEAHLRTNYEFAFANSETNAMPEGLDPVDLVPLRQYGGDVRAVQQRLCGAGQVSGNTGESGVRLGNSGSRSSPNRVFQPGSSVGGGTV